MFKAQIVEKRKHHYYVKTNGMIKDKLQQIVSSLYTNMKYDQENILNSTMLEKTVNIHVQWCVSKVFQYI